MSLENWNAAIRPKAHGSRNLCAVLPAKLDFFIMLSSQSGILGSYGQSNYAAGNTYQDAFAAHLSRSGIRAVSIDLGPIESVGYVAENRQIQERLRARSHAENISEEQLLTMLRHFCDPSFLVDDADSSQIITALPVPAELRKRGIVEPAFLSRPILSHLHSISPDDLSTSQPTENGHDTPVEFSLKEAKTVEEASHIICSEILLQLAKLLAVDKETIDAKKPINAFGVDSLIAVEIRNWFLKAVGADVPVFEILESTPIAELAQRVTQKSRFTAHLS